LELAGKTGTTNNYVDAWFCGYSPTLTTIIWYGRDRYKSIGNKMSGGRVSAPVFSYFYRNLLKIEPDLERKFYVPKGVKIGVIDGRKEYYTKISPLPKGGAPLDIFDTDTTPPEVNNNKKPPKESSDGLDEYEDMDNETKVKLIEEDEDIEILFNLYNLPPKSKYRR